MDVVNDINAIMSIDELQSVREMTSNDMLEFLIGKWGEEYLINFDSFPGEDLEPDADYIIYDNFKNNPRVRTVLETFPSLEIRFAHHVWEELYEQLTDTLHVDPETFMSYKNKFNPDTDGAGENVIKYKEFLEEESVCNLRYALKQAGYKGYSRMRKEQLIAYILREINL